MADEKLNENDAVSADAENVEERVAEAAPVEEPVAEAETPAEDAPAEAAEQPVAEAPAAEEEAPADPEAAEDVSDEPAAEAPAADESAEESRADDTEAASDTETGTSTASAEPKRKRKRLPRALRPQRTRPKRVAATERKPIVRLEKPEHERGRRQERQGTVVSDAMEKTIVVRVDVVKAHPRYKKVVRRSVKFHAHDENGQAKVGDVVRIVETRPLSKTKRWRLAEVVEAAK